jgi:hypothetical protein
VGVREARALGRLIFAALLWALLLPESACALSSSAETGLTNISQGEPQNGPPRDANKPPFELFPDNEWTIKELWMASPAWVFAASSYQSMATGAPLIEDSDPVAFDIGSYDAMWQDTVFTEIAAYGGLDRDVQRVAAMEAIGGSDGAAGIIPYGRLTLQREFQEGRHSVVLGAYGLHASVRPTAISGFGDDSYTDVAVDGTYRWTMHPERGVSDTFTAHLLFLHESEDLIASHAVFGTRSTDDLTIFRGDVTYSWGAPVAPVVQYFQITGSSDPVRLATPNGSPDSTGLIAEMDYAPWSEPDSPLNRLNVRLALQFIAYSEFDGSSHNASENNTVLLHVTVGALPDP